MSIVCDPVTKDCIIMYTTQGDQTSILVETPNLQTSLHNSVNCCVFTLGLLSLSQFSSHGVPIQVNLNEFFK